MRFFKNLKKMDTSCLLDIRKSSILTWNIIDFNNLFSHVFAKPVLVNFLYVFLRKLCVALDLHRWVAAQSIFYHLYNQVSYMSLDQISPLTFSIGNTMKRISVIVSSIIIFHTPVQPINALGAAIAILGTFIYSQVYSHTFLDKYDKFWIVVEIFQTKCLAICRKIFLFSVLYCPLVCMGTKNLQNSLSIFFRAIHKFGGWGNPILW